VNVDAHLPLALWRLHQCIGVGDRTDALSFDRPADAEPPALLELLFEGGGFVEVAVETTARRRRVTATRARSLADSVGPGLALLCVGLNPSVRAADAGVGFVTPGNRFWPAAMAAGIVSVDRDPLHALQHHRVGMTDLVKRATPRADEISAAEYVHGMARLDLLCSLIEPAVVCFVGLSGWRAAVDRRATVGWQDRPVGGRPAFVIHNPSGLNAHVRVDDLARQLTQAAAGPP